jgi:hypothetical protein
MAVGTRMQQRRASAADWTTSNYVLAAGEIGVVSESGAFKVGNGVTAWTDLDFAFDGTYLPILGTAANADLLGGVSAASFVKVADTDTAASNNTYVKRTSAGRIKAIDASASDDVTTLSQQTAAITLASQNVVSRTLAANGTAALTDVNKTILVLHASLTAQVTVTIPQNSTVAIPVGSIIDVVATGEGGAKLVPAAGGIVTLYGKVNVLPRYGQVRLTKIGTDQWMCVETAKGRNPTFKIRRTGAGDNYGSSYQFVPFDFVDTTATYNPDSDWFSIPASGTAAARRIVINKDGEYEFTAAMATNGTGGITYCRITSMTADNSTTGMKPFGVQSMTAVAVVTARRAVTAGESFGVHHGFVAGNLGKADAEATGGDPHYFKITRVGD